MGCYGGEPRECDPPAGFGILVASVVCAAARRQNPVRRPGPSRHGKRIAGMVTPSLLITDDDAAFRETVGELFRPRGFRVILAGDGEEALQVVVREEVHLILLDMHMPKLDGLATLSRLKQFNAGLPCILISACWDEVAYGTRPAGRRVFGPLQTDQPRADHRDGGAGSCSGSTADLDCNKTRFVARNSPLPRRMTEIVRPPEGLCFRRPTLVAWCGIFRVFGRVAAGLRAPTAKVRQAVRHGQ